MKIRSQKIINLETKGFTVVETLVAVTILLISIVGPLQIASKGLFSAFYARDEITGFYLAQEGVEFVRNFRDNTYITNRNSGTPYDWLSGLNLCFSTVNNGAGCKIDATIVNPAAAITACDSTLLPDHCEKLRYDGTFFSYAGSYPLSKYSRKIVITKSPNIQGTEDEAKITSTVTWDAGTVFGSQKRIVIEETLLNYLQQQ